MHTKSLPGESNPGCLRTEACLPLPLSRRKCVGMFPGVLGGSRTRNRRLLKPPSLPRLEYEHGEPPPGADPGRPLYESGAATVRGGVAAHRGFEPRLAHPECAVLPVERMGIVLARAPPRDRTECPSIKSRVLHRYSSRRVQCRWSRSRPVFAVPFARFAQCQAARSGTSRGNSAAWLMITEYLQLIWCGISMKSKSP